MDISRTTRRLLIIVPLFVEVFSLEVVPLEKNVIVNTESIIRNVTNDIFVELRLKGIKNNTKLQQQNLIHNFFIKLGVADQHTLVAVNTLSRFDKTNINNISLDFMNILNELLHEDWINEGDHSLSGNINVLKVINNYLSGERYEKYVGKMKNDDFNEVIEMLESELAEENLVENSDEDTIFGPNNNGTGNEFWKPGLSGRRIFQGTRTKIKHFPFMASIQIFRSFQCGGSIIKSDLILTAASCLQLAYNNRFFRENPAFLSVTIGSDFYQGGGDNIQAQEVYFHPSYNPKTLRNNLAVVRLQRHINFKKTKRVKMIEIDRKAHNIPYNAGPVTIVGWGARTSSNILDNPWSNRLSYAQLGPYDHRDCEDIYSKEYVTQTNFCAGFVSKGSGACNKDAGDPGIIDGIQVGVASFGSPVCGTPDAPTVFTKIGFFAEWIDEIMETEPTTRRWFTTTMSPRPPYTPDLSRKLHQQPFAVTPITKQLTVKIPPTYDKLLRNEKRNQDEELENILLKMMDDKNTDPSELRERIQKMVPQIKKYATSPKLTHEEDLMTTDFAHQKHTILENMINEDEDAMMIDKLDDETSDNTQEKQMSEEPDIMRGRNKASSKTQEGTIGFPDLDEGMSLVGSMEDREIPKIPDDTRGIGSLKQESADGVLTDGNASVEIKEAKTVQQLETKEEEVTNKVILEPNKQDLKKKRVRDIENKMQRNKINEIENEKKNNVQSAPKNFKKPEVNKDLSYSDEEKPEIKKDIIYSDEEKPEIKKDIIYSDDEKPEIKKDIIYSDEEKPEIKKDIIYSDEEKPEIKKDIIYSDDEKPEIKKDIIYSDEEITEVKKDVIYNDEEDEFVTKKIKRTKAKDLVPKDEQKHAQMTINTKIVADDSIVSGWKGFINNLGQVNDDKQVVFGDVRSSGDRHEGVYDELDSEIDVVMEEQPTNQRNCKNKCLKRNDGAIILENDEKISKHRDKFDYIHMTSKSSNIEKHNKKIKNKATDDEVLTFLYLLSEENAKEKIKNEGKNGDENKKIIQTRPKQFLDFHNANDEIETKNKFNLPPKSKATKTLYDNLQKDKLYDLLAEAIDEMTAKKRNKAKLPTNLPI